MKVDERTAHVRLESGQVKAGDGVAVIGWRCSPENPSGFYRHPGSEKCEQVVRGVGKVTEVLNDRYSVVEFPEPVDFREGDEVRPNPAEP